MLQNANLDPSQIEDVMDDLGDCIEDVHEASEAMQLGDSGDMYMDAEAELAALGSEPEPALGPPGPGLVAPPAPAPAALAMPVAPSGPLEELRALEAAM